MVEPILSQGYGYGFALGLGAAFAILMVSISKSLSVYMGQVQNSERFSTASRSVKSGLIASSTVSAWTWPATLLSSGSWSYSHGIMGGWVYGVSGAIQITLFLFLAIQIKRYAPSIHTVSECFYIRFGKVGHWCFLFYCVATNVLISSLLLLGGSQGFAAATGMHVVAASFLLPLNVVIYTALGGLKATFISDWIHTVIIYIILLVSCYTIYCSSSLIGSPGKMYDLLIEAQDVFPSASGKSYVNFHDKSMIMLTWSVCIGGLSSVFGDPGYSQRAIASDSSSVFWGYLMGGICWWIIPFALGSSGGLACRALLTNPASVTYPNALSDAEVDAGMPVVYGLYAIFGSPGAAMALVMLFMSVTSATSAELIAFSSVSTYDIYRTYINPQATGKQLVRASHIAVVSFGLGMGVLSVVFNYIGVTTGWMLSFIGIILTPEVSAVSLMLFWPKMTKLGLIIGAPLGTLTGIACWIGATYVYADHVINKDTVMTTAATLIGNLVAFGAGTIYMVVISYLKPDPEPFDLSALGRGVQAGDDVDKEEMEHMDISDKQKKTLTTQSYASLIINVVIVLGIYILQVVAMYGVEDELSKKSFTGFIVVMLIWLLLAALYIILFPLWQGRKSLMFVFPRLLRLKKGGSVLVTEPAESQSSIDIEAPKGPEVKTEVASL
ncbi:unnamed protein product [Kuraishia capsulata CBS 1993]|uniref:Urea active transporter n=1 Tax=Kuraishia capsulata CBS 1993 TaxID=1382522 RepID=W6MST8_9ASCO|nr:uncharacterized protein KUCA_T00005416001 [Kuraishia capsulata CBS 1993]CDK29428.1 unnamed protein product [Kuraishia capsulata CBS 1993]